MTSPAYTVPGMDRDATAEAIQLLENRLASLIDLALTLKHIHWNVVGQDFIAVHEMLDPQVDAVRTMVDDVAERIATMGGEPAGTPGAVIESRSWDDYALGRATVDAHLGALDMVYRGVIEDHRKAQARLAELDPVSEGLMVDQLTELELFHWFVRAHLESAAGELATAGAVTEQEAAAAARGAG